MLKKYYRNYTTLNVHKFKCTLKIKYGVLLYETRLHSTQIVGCAQYIRETVSVPFRKLFVKNKC